MWQREDDVEIVAVKAPVDQTFAPLFPSLVSACWTVKVGAVIETNQPLVATLAVVEVSAFIHHRAEVCESLAVVTLLIELGVPTIPPQDVVDFEAIGFRLR